MDATSICWMTATFRTSACLRPPALWVRLLLRLPALPSPARACDQGARCPSAQLGIPQAYRPPLWRKAPNCLSHRLSTAAPDMFSLLSVRMAVSSCSRIQPPACFGWTPLSAHWLLVHAPFCTPVSLECLCLRPGHSGATMMFCHPWDAAARILLVFIRPLLASATLTAPLPHVTQRAILSPWPPPSHPACSLSFPCWQIPLSFLTGGHFFRLRSSGLCPGHALRMEQVPPALGSGVWRHLAFCQAFCRT